MNIIKRCCRRLARQIKHLLAPQYKISRSRRLITIYTRDQNQGDKVFTIARCHHDLQFALQRDTDGAEATAAIHITSKEGAIDHRLAPLDLWSAQRLMRDLFRQQDGFSLRRWGLRLIGLWLAWVFISGAVNAQKQQAPAVAAAGDIGSQGPMGESVNAPDLAPSPAAAPPFDQITQAIMARAQEEAVKAQPPIMGGSMENNLQEFGLDGTQGEAAGCDPKLAFKAPESP